MCLFVIRRFLFVLFVVSVFALGNKINATKTFSTSDKFISLMLTPEKIAIMLDLS